MGRHSVINLQTDASQEDQTPTTVKIPSTRPKPAWRTPSRPLSGEALKKGRKQPLPVFHYN